MEGAQSHTGKQQPQPALPVQAQSRLKHPQLLYPSRLRRDSSPIGTGIFLGTYFFTTFFSLTIRIAFRLICLSWNLILF